MARTKTKKAPILTQAAAPDFTNINPVYGGVRFNSGCILEYSVNVESKTVSVRVTNEITGTVYSGNADLVEVE